MLLSFFWQVLEDDERPIPIGQSDKKAWIISFKNFLNSMKEISPVHSYFKVVVGRLLIDFNGSENECHCAFQQDSLVVIRQMMREIIF